MKNYFYSFIIGLLCSTCPVQAQVENQGKQDSIKIDSLNNVIASLNQENENYREQEKLSKVWKRKKYRYVGYTIQSLTHLDEKNLRWKSDMGFNYGMGRTFYLHKKPLGGIVKFAIDWTYADVNYAKLKENYRIVGMTSTSHSNPSNSEGFDDIVTPDNVNVPTVKLGCHAIDVGMQIGPSVWVNPVDHLMVNGYFRYAPTAAMLILDDEFSIGYGSFFVTGGSISYKSISIGIEARWGKTKYNSFEIDDDETDDMLNGEGDGSVTGLLNSSKNKMKMKSTRFYICFRI